MAAQPMPARPSLVVERPSDRHSCYFRAGMNAAIDQLNEAAKADATTRCSMAAQTVGQLDLGERPTP